jgi:hypothetical protein
MANENEEPQPQHVPERINRSSRTTHRQARNEIGVYNVTSVKDNLELTDIPLQKTLSKLGKHGRGRPVERWVISR